MFPKLAVTGTVDTPGGPATVADGLLLSCTGLSSLVQMAAVVPQSRLPGSVTVTASLPHGVTVISQLSFRPLFRRARGHLAVRDRERVVAQRLVADSDVAVEDGVEGERCAAVVLARHVLEAAGQYLRVEDGAGSRSSVHAGDIRAGRAHQE